MPVRDRDRPSAHQEPRAGDGAGGDRVAQLERGAVAAAQIAQHGHAGEERVARVDGAAQPYRQVAVVLDVLERHGARAERDVHVRVHHPRHDGGAEVVDAGRAGNRAASSPLSPTATMRSPCTATAPRASGSRPVPSMSRSAQIKVTELSGLPVMSEILSRSAASPARRSAGARPWCGRDRARRPRRG